MLNAILVAINKIYMKIVSTLLLSLLCFSASAQEKDSYADLEKQMISKARQTPEYKKAVTDVSVVRKDIELAGKGTIKSGYVVKDYNDRLGRSLGKKQTLNDVKFRIDNAGDNYIKMVLSKQVARIATEEAKLATEEAKKRQN